MVQWSAELKAGLLAGLMAMVSGDLMALQKVVWMDDKSVLLMVRLMDDSLDNCLVHISQWKDNLRDV